MKVTKLKIIIYNYKFICIKEVKYTISFIKKIWIKNMRNLRVMNNDPQV